MHEQERLGDTTACYKACRFGCDGLRRPRMSLAVGIVGWVSGWVGGGRGRAKVGAMVGQFVAATWTTSTKLGTRCRIESVLLVGDKGGDDDGDDDVRGGGGGGGDDKGNVKQARKLGRRLFSRSTTRGMACIRLPAATV